MPGAVPAQLPGAVPGSSPDPQYEQKNVRRRVYDALNVLMAMQIISKERKQIKWLGLPPVTTAVQVSGTGIAAAVGTHGWSKKREQIRHFTTPRAGRSLGLITFCRNDGLSAQHHSDEKKYPLLTPR